MTNQTDEQMTNKIENLAMEIAEKLIPDSMDPSSHDGRLPYIQVLEVLSKSEIITLARGGLKLREDTKFKVDMATAVSVEDELRKHIFTLNAKLEACRVALNVQIETAKVYAVELDSLRADKKSLISALQSCAEVVGDVSAFGSCDCDIPAGKTCVVCEAALVLKTATGALDSARKDKSA